MIRIKQGNILEVKKGIICHQVNCMGVMGGGLAMQIKKKYPNVFMAYHTLCKLYNPETLIGTTQIVECDSNNIIVNVFGQKNHTGEKVLTDYYALLEAFTSLLMQVKAGDFGKTNILMPYKIGCGLAGGDWDIVYGILNGLSNYLKCDITLYQYQEGDLPIKPKNWFMRLFERDKNVDRYIHPNEDIVSKKLKTIFPNDILEKLLVN